MPRNVVIIGAGPAAAETALALRELAGDRVALTLAAPERTYRTRAWSVAEPFGGEPPAEHTIGALARFASARLVRDTVVAVDTDRQVARTSRGRLLRYDDLVVATGAATEPAVAGALTFRGDAESVAAVSDLVGHVDTGLVRSVLFVTPPGPCWPLPAYELALQLAGRARHRGLRREITIVAHERWPLRAFGLEASREARLLLLTLGVDFIGGERAVSDAPGTLRLAGSGLILRADRIVAVPRLRGRRIDGLPSDADGFLPVDERGRVEHVAAVWAAGDVCAGEPKLGSVATRQGDAIAAAIAQLAGVAVEPEVAEATAEAVLLTGELPIRLRRAGLAPESGAGWRKVTGRHLDTWLRGHERRREEVVAHWPEH